MNEEKLDLREILGIFLIILGTKLSDMSPTLLAHHGKNAFWMIAAVNFIVFTPVYLLLIMILTRLKDKNIIEAIYELLGKYLGFIVCLILFLAALTTSVLDSRSYVDEINHVYYEQSPVTVLYFIFFIVCVFGARKGLANIGYTAWAVFPYIKIALFILFFLALQDIIWLRLFPIFGEGPYVILTQGVLKSSLFGGDLVLFLVAFTAVKDATTFKNGTYISLAVAVTEIVIFYMVYCTLFDYKSIDKIAYPFHELTNFVSLGEFFTNVETFFFGFWIVAGFVRFIVYLYITTRIFGTMFFIKDYKPLFPAFALIIITLGVLPENSFEVVLIYKDNFLNLFSMFRFMLPVLLWVGGKLKGAL